VAFSCVNASNQYFAIAPLNVSVPPVTFSLWVNTASVIAKDTALIIWRGSVNTGIILRYVAPNWELRYYTAGGSQWMTATGLQLSTGAWQHVCVAIDSTHIKAHRSAAGGKGGPAPKGSGARAAGGPRSSTA